MNALRTLFLLAAGLSVACCDSALSTNDKAITQFRQMILCMMPDSWPNFDYSNYGCYCGVGGTGTPVDKLDRCCQVHDNCYRDAMQLKECTSFFDNPYINFYSYRCAKARKKITCGKNNNACEMFICKCDRKAAKCFARSCHNPKNKHLPSDRCQ
ncbi:phospholipase A2, minor isoenzyme [Hippoglossus stenolepis]|uniref:phospholipase A2, minor isoenzyme n=1 Tax=Hippoglossus stenolepis TaxID=195615 RepID=UPI00159C219E|nr:phospholipase A2, minor isoenzyme [Hippoglossus stenolepis]